VRQMIQIGGTSTGLHMYMKPISAHMYAMLDDEAHAMFFLERSLRRAQPPFVGSAGRPRTGSPTRLTPFFATWSVALSAASRRLPAGDLPEHEPVRGR